ncbi:hypothetical protein diail_5245 [Diaporthe ilicicola]|nr:hypothetical protein diail_5245 [Diaporthe ilicicola]
MAEIPAIQVLEKEHYFTQHLVSLPDAIPYAPLGPSSVRVRTKVMSVGWIPYELVERPSTPTLDAWHPFNDATKYGRIDCWGFAEVLDSTHPGVEKGSYLWGYLPIGMLAQDLAVEEGDVPGHSFVKNGYRQEVFPAYNRHFVFPPQLRSAIEARAEDVAYDAMVRVMSETAYLMSGFGADTERANIEGATVICLAPGSKAALCLARELGHGQKKSAAKVIGAASDYSLELVRATGESDEVISTSERPSSVLTGVPDGGKVVLVDFGGRGGVAQDWPSVMSQTGRTFALLKCSREISEEPPSKVLASFQAAPPAYEAVQVNASDIRDRAIVKIGKRAILQGF